MCWAIQCGESRTCKGDLVQSDSLGGGSGWCWESWGLPKHQRHHRFISLESFMMRSRYTQLPWSLSFFGGSYRTSRQNIMRPRRRLDCDAERRPCSIIWDRSLSLVPQLRNYTLGSFLLVSATLWHGHDHVITGESRQRGQPRR